MFGRSAQVIWGERDEMTINIGTAGPAHISGSARQPARQAPSGRRQYVITFVMLAAVARRAVDRRTLRGVIVLAIGLVAATRLAKDRGTPGLDWYRARGRDVRQGLQAHNLLPGPEPAGQRADTRAAHR